MFELLQERVRVSLQFDQQVGAGSKNGVCHAGCAGCVWLSVAGTPAQVRLPSLPATCLLPARLQMVSGEQIAQALAFAADERLPGGERLSFRLALISLLKEQGQRMAQVGAGLPMPVAAVSTVFGQRRQAPIRRQK